VEIRNRIILYFRQCTLIWREIWALIKAVTFDLWNTLIKNTDYTRFRVEYLAEVLSERGAPRSQDEIREAYVSAQISSRKIEESSSRRYVTTEEKLDHILEMFRVALSRDVRSTVVGRLQAVIWNDPPFLKDGVVETLEALKPRFRMAIISDSGITPGRIVREVLGDAGILDYFSSTVFSDEVGLCKPHSAMFERALEEVGAGPREAVHVGDLLHTDIAGAKAMGMKAIWVKTDETPVKHSLEPDYEVTTLSEVIPILDEISKH
jgi:putative hydrolase of the HAD superfamily